VWGKSALFVDPEKPAELGEVIEALVSDGALLNEMQRRAAGRACRYRAGRMAERYLELYGVLAEGVRNVESLSPARGGR
jgi:glycosyltransferase involved in cell wall biosynthesis